MSVREQKFANAAALADTLATEIAAALSTTLAGGGNASLAVPGGRTPTGLFERLCGEALDWRRVGITLTDERWVDVASSTSNEKLVRDRMLRNHAACAHFVGLKNDAADPREGAPASWAALQSIARPFDCVVLGMGEDGHVASLFPDSPGVAIALDATQAPACVAMTAPVAPRARLSLNIAALLDARRVVLLIVGAAKWSTYERACMRGPVVDMPVRALLQQQQVPVSVYWSP